jgi:putative PIN family toxin of toxin-antitoxin system
MKVLLDTNVLVAAFIAHGTCAELLEHCALKHEIVLSEFILEEFFRVLSVKLRFPVEKIRAAVRILRSKVTHVEPGPLTGRICRDPDDDMIVATALTGRVACLVTGDRELLELRAVDGIRVIRPNDFWRFESELEVEAGG